MLENTFCHIPGIGLKTERRLWEKGLLSWDAVADCDEARISLPGGMKGSIAESSERLTRNDPAYFSKRLPPREAWRIYSDFRNSTAFIDIETNGYMGPRGYITAISIYDGSRVRYYVRGENLDEFKRDIQDYKLIITYNGKCFDVPFIETHFKIKLNHAHIDLRYALKDLGFSGGLKGCEKALGIDRGTLEGVDGYYAVLLWRDYRRNRNPKALETLLAYNIQDVVNLEPLMVEAYNLSLKKTPFESTRRLTAPPPPSELPFAPDAETIERIAWMIRGGPSAGV